MVALELTRVQPSEAHAYKKAVEFLSFGSQPLEYATDSQSNQWR